MKDASQNSPYILWFHLHEMYTIGIFTDRDCDWLGLGALGEMGSAWKWVHISLWGDENVLKLIVIVVAQLCEYIKIY